MGFTEVYLRDIVPNPFRNLTKYPLDPEKVKRLRGSISRTDFWDNVVARKRADGLYELAYGHHRIAAAREQLGEDAKVNLIVRDIDDQTMLQMMASDNDDISIGTPFMLEVVEAALKIFGAEVTGKSIAKHKPYTRGYTGRVGHTKLSGQKAGAVATKIAKFLGWKIYRLQRLMAILNGIKSGAVNPEIPRVLPEINPLSTLAYTFRYRASQGKPIPYDKQLELARKVANYKGSKVAMADAISANLVHPDIGERADVVLRLLKKAAGHAHSLDLTLAALKEHKERLHSEAYRGSLAAVTLAASLKDVVDLVNEVFTRPQLSESQSKRIAAQSAAKEEVNV